MARIPHVSRLAIDATFKSSPGQFYQVIIINILIFTIIVTTALYRQRLCRQWREWRVESSILLSDAEDMRRCQMKVQFESGANIKFLVALFQSMTSISDYQSVPWSHSFLNMYDTHMCKMYLTVEK